MLGSLVDRSPRNMPLQDEDDWLHCTLCRSGRQGTSTLTRAMKRKIDWPSQGTEPLYSSQEPRVHVGIDEVFDTVLQYMTITSRQCRRYFRGQTLNQCSYHDMDHCKRFHQPGYTTLSYRNPLQKAEDVQVEVAPGSYAVTAGRWGAERDHTHVIRIEPGQTIDMSFAV